MTVTKTDVVDSIYLERETGRIVLALLDELDWSDELAHLQLLQEKLNTYLAYVEGGGLEQQLEAGASGTVPPGTPVHVHIYARCPPTPKAQRFLQLAERTFAGAGFTLSHAIVDPDPSL